MRKTKHQRAGQGRKKEGRPQAARKRRPLRLKLRDQPDPAAELKERLLRRAVPALVTKRLLSLKRKGRAGLKRAEGLCLACFEAFARKEASLTPPPPDFAEH